MYHASGPMCWEFGVGVEGGHVPTADKFCGCLRLRFEVHGTWTRGAALLRLPGVLTGIGLFP